MTLTYVNPHSDTVRLVHLPQTSSKHVTADACMYSVNTSTVILPNLIIL
jgi:hypothetical protein